MISTNIEKAKFISHAIRRASRAKEFAPYDDLISKQIPSFDVGEIEAERVAIREKYKIIQTNIDEASSVETLKSILESI